MKINGVYLFKNTWIIILIIKTYQEEVYLDRLDQQYRLPRPCERHKATCEQSCPFLHVFFPPVKINLQ